MSEKKEITNLTLSELLIEQQSPAPEEKVNDDNVFSLDNSPFNLPLRISTFSSEKELDAFIKSVEKTIRHSLEYRYWVEYITDSLGQSECAFTHENINECSIEVHHHPITLYTIVKAVINNYLVHNQEFSSFDIATKVIELHFQNKVGYVVILSDLHKKYHGGFLKIPMELVKGDYKFLIKSYTFDENEMQRIYELCAVKAEDVSVKWSKNNYPGVDGCLKLEESKEQPRKVLEA